MKNYEKQKIYVDIFSRLKKAIDLGFDFQAIVYEYSILEDRIESILKIANKSTTTIGIQKKLNIMKNNINEKTYNKYFDLSLINKIENWKDLRNSAIHALAKRPFSEAEIREISLDGYELVKLVSKKTTLYKKAIEKILRKSN